MPCEFIGLSRDGWLARFDQYLKDVRGLRPGSRRVYRRYVQEFLTDQFPDSAICDLRGLSAKRLWEFIKMQAVRREASTLKTVLPAIRSFLRYLVLLGICDASLIKAVPSVPRRRLSSLPVALSEEQLLKLLHGFNRATPIGRRDYAIAGCLSRLGLRAGEVAHLTLDDVDWRGPTVRLRSDKERRDSSLPLPEDVGVAIVAYLRDGRPATGDRHLFVRHRAPHLGQALTSSAVCQVIRRAWHRCDPGEPRRGTHALRHSLASRLLAGGADLKRVADILRHRSLDTTMIYSRLDHPHLAEVMQEWPTPCP